MYTDATMLTFGKYKFKKLRDIPSEYLIKIYHDKGIKNEELKAYIENNLEVIKHKADSFVVAMPTETITRCAKLAYPNEKEAKFKLKVIRDSKQKHNKPVRAYECEVCGGWHLTSIPFDKWRK